MALSINTNIASLQAQNNLSQVNKALEQNQERLSSGLRINSAADDAAGLAISDRMNAQIKGMNQASRNASDGISMSQTAEGGLQEITNILQRMRELGVQSANESNTEQDRESLNDEFTKLTEELDRIAQSTSFNGKTLLDGTRGTAEFQVGPNTGSDNIIEVDMSTSVKKGDIGQLYDGGSFDIDSTEQGSLDLSNAELTMDGETYDLSDVGSSANAVDVADTIDDDMDGIYASATATEAVASAGSAAGGAVASAEAYDLTINGQSAASYTASSAQASAGDIVTDINNNVSGVSAAVSGTEITVTNTDGDDADNITITESGDVSLFNAASSDGTQYAAYGGVDVTGRDEVTIEDTSDTGSVISNTSNADTKGDGLDQANIKDVYNAHQAIDKIDNAINKVDEYRATFGATQNRLDSTIANLENASQNLTEARSRIQDADIAKEAAEQTQNNVRRQAAASVLTQANQSPQLALQLLGG